jgi:hypothetical protein
MDKFTYVDTNKFLIMKSIFDKEIRNEVVSRINSLNENSKAQ